MPEILSMAKKGKYKKRTEGPSLREQAAQQQKPTSQPQQTEQSILEEPLRISTSVDKYEKAPKQQPPMPAPPTTPSSRDLDKEKAFLTGRPPKSSKQPYTPAAQLPQQPYTPRTAGGPPPRPNVSQLDTKARTSPPPSKKSVTTPPPKPVKAKPAAPQQPATPPAQTPATKQPTAEPVRTDYLTSKSPEIKGLHSKIEELTELIEQYKTDIAEHVNLKEIIDNLAKYVHERDELAQKLSQSTYKSIKELRESLEGKASADDVAEQIQTVQNIQKGLLRLIKLGKEYTDEKLENLQHQQPTAAEPQKYTLGKFLEDVISHLRRGGREPKGYTEPPKSIKDPYAEVSQRIIRD